MHARILEIYKNKTNIPIKQVLDELARENADSNVYTQVLSAMVHRVKCENANEFYTLLIAVAQNNAIVKLLLENKNNKKFLDALSPSVLPDLILMMQSSEASASFYTSLIATPKGLAQLTANNGEVIIKLREVFNTKPDFYQQLVSNMYQQIPMSARLVVSELASQYQSSKPFREFIGGNIKLMKDAPQNDSPLIDSIVAKLDAYMKRIDQDGVDHFKFFLFKQSRIANRKVNYDIAKKIKNALLQRDANKSELDAIRDVFSEYHYTFSNLYFYIQTTHNGTTHSIRSSELAGIINDAKDLVVKNTTNKPVL